MKYDVYISDYKKTKVIQLPIIPPELPSLSKPIANEEFETYWSGVYNFIEKPGLLAFTLDSWLPEKANKYNFSRSQINPLDCIKSLEDARDNAEPIRIIISTQNNISYVNDIYSIESFSYNVNKRNDYQYSLGVKQWREYTSKIPTIYKVGWDQNNNGWFYYTDEEGNYYKDGWEIIDNEYYSFDINGYMRQSAWLKDGGSWYYLKDSGKMARNEWITIDSKSYYFGEQGGMYVNAYTPDGYYVDENGVWVK
ncbi:autolysin [Clostridium puniceum]|uniref:Autolysin n=1 Tax=Clostridium puniceum TaxID=29367 RepID=A0A1S8TWM9_9CLOT|nr:cell wall-binding protein [Clostridium puniceum]OOM81795.1 autolysin [Clostridium puniceum]